MKLDIPKLLQHDRVEHDFYPTPVDVTQALMNVTSEETKAKRWIEPACGDGDISMVLEANGCDVQSFDLRDDCYGIGGIDYLNTPMETDCVITNPPFSLAPDFIEKACNEARVGVAMLLKSNFWHASRRAALFSQYTPALILPLLWRPAFLSFARGKSPFMDVCWNVWKTNVGPTDCQYVPLERPKEMPRLPLEYHINQLTRCLEAEHGRS